MEDKSKKTMIGVVVGDKMDKSRTVMVERTRKHPLYKKYIKERTKFMVHDSANESEVGDRVVIEESKPLSKKKRWALSEIITKAV